jgi:hypothetical protein
MQKVGRLSNCAQQLCILHGIKLGVQDVLYKKIGKFSQTVLKGILDIENSSESDYDTTNDDEEDF